MSNYKLCPNGHYYNEEFHRCPYCARKSGRSFVITGNKSKIFAKGEIGNVRKAQEDSHGLKLGTPNGDLFVVCDGMGGHVGGAKASSIAVKSIINRISEEKRPTPIDALHDALDYANMQILGFANDHPEFKGMGTTACVLLLQDDGAWIAHVGDSRIYLYLGKEKQLHRITKDHSYVQTLVDANQMTDEQAEHSPYKNRIMKALGIKPELQPTFNYENRPIHPKNGDIFLICSDGLSGMIPDKTIERVLGGNMTLQEKGDELMRLAMLGETVQPGGQDNCTVELIEIDNSKWKKSEFKSYNPNQTSVEQIKKAPVNGAKLVRIILIAMVSLLLLGTVALSLYPGRYDPAIKKAESAMEETSKTLDSLQKRYSEVESNPWKKNEAIFIEDTIENARKKHEESKQKLVTLQKKKEKLSSFWRRILPTLKREEKNKN